MGLPEYDGAFVYGSGIPSGVLRFAGYVVVGVYMESASTVYNYIKSHAVIVQQPPFNPNTLYLSHLALKWSQIGFWWNFAMWIPTVISPSVFVTIIGLFDVTLAVYFGIATVRQGAYIPHTEGPCSNADTWQVPTNGNSSYFHVLGTLNTYPDKPESHVPSEEICKDFVTQWRLGIGSLVIYILVSFFNVIVSMTISIRGLRSRMCPDKKRKEPYVLTVGKVFLLVPYSICNGLIIPIRFSISLLPHSTQTRIRFGLRYFNKASQLVRHVLIRDVFQNIHLSLTRFKYHWPRPESKEVQVEIENESAPLARFLHIDILTLVAQHLHYQDLVNLSLASQEMRRTLFPDGHFGSGAGILRTYTCDDDTKTRCFVCRFPICRSCGEIRRFTRLQLDIFHDETCRPFCTPCYYEKLSTSSQSYKRHCSRKSTLPINMHGLRGHFDTSTFENDRLLCSPCSKLHINRCLFQRHEQEKIKMKRKLRDPKHRDDSMCKNCSKAFPFSGPRWWMCEGCNYECMDPLHPPWGFKPSHQRDIAGIAGYALLEV